MASLKEVKGRITSVDSTRKITSAMKMVASAKLHKAQAAIENMLPYQKRLNNILTSFLSGGLGRSVDLPYVERREVKRVAIVVFSSNSSLCGGFNATIVKQLIVVLDEYKSLGMENVLLYPVGKKVAEAVKKMGLKTESDYQEMADKPSYDEASELASRLMELYRKKELDKVELIYNHFRSTALQILTREMYLPIELKENKKSGEVSGDYIIEPSPREFLTILLPKVLRLKMYTVLLDSNASEHAARMMAMQAATDNANDLLQNLTIAYNKSRQQAITSELLDIIGGSMK